MSSNATVASNEARQITGTIEDDDNPPVASISATYAVGERDGANDADGLVVTLSAPSTKTVTVSYAFEDGTAVNSRNGLQLVTDDILWTFMPGWQMV